jgi:hypothetical protein
MTTRKAKANAKTVVGETARGSYNESEPMRNSKQMVAGMRRVEVGE